jgi:hypothetical protein
MAGQGSKIVTTPNPKGVFIEGTIIGTPSPGTLMQIDASGGISGNRLDWEPFGSGPGVGADGEQRLIAVLDYDKNQGKLNTDAYVTGTYGQMYVPIAGETMNVLVSATGTATSDAVAIGDVFIINDGDGLLIATTGSPESEPFQCIEVVSDVVVTGTLVHCMYTGY